MNKQFIVITVVCCMFAGCKKGNDAQNRLDKAKELYTSQQFASAKNEIDSIHLLFPREVAIRKEALNLMRHVERGECVRNIAYCDSLLPIRFKEVDMLKKGFIFEKDTAYDKMGKYIWSTMTVDRNIERSYIRCGVDEEGEMYIASVYFGSAPLNHTGLAFATNNGTHAETPSIPYDGGVNYRFKDLGNTTEVVTYKGINCQDITDMTLVVSEKERIKATYTGGKPFSLYLTDTDKKAIRATYELALVLKDIDSLQRERERSGKKIVLIDQKLN